MHRLHVTLVALLLAGAAVLGTVAVARTTHLGSTAHHTKDAAFAARTRQLTRYAAKLRRELKARPPALPPVPKPQPAPVATAAPPSTAAPRIVYHRPPAVVVTIHHSHGDDGAGEAEGGGRGDD
jgi:hypothetical protein